MRLHRCELVRGLLGVVGGELVEAVEQRLGLGDALLHVAEHVLGLVEMGLLLEHPHRGARRERGLPAVLLVEPRHDPQQRGLAGAVVAEHADLRAGVERERELVESTVLSGGCTLERRCIVKMYWADTAAQDREGGGRGGTASGVGGV